MRSMTGYGKGEATAPTARATVEITAVNSRKQADVRLVLSREIAGIEPALRRRLAKDVSRGSLTVAVYYELSNAGGEARVSIDRAAAAGAARALRELARDLGLDDSVGVRDLLLVPGVVREGGPVPLALIERPVLEALDQALAALQQMQGAEGVALRDDLLRRQQRLHELLDVLEAGADTALASCQARLAERVRMLGVEVNLDDERLAKEVAFLAQRSDISEECVRLDSHLRQMAALLETDTPGRTLDFLGQEMNREITTLAAKVSDTRLADAALAFKTELARVREQLQNIE